MAHGPARTVDPHQADYAAHRIRLVTANVEERMIKGFGQLQKQLQMAQEALKRVEGQLGTVHFDPDDPESIERAMRQINAIIEERLGDYLDNPIIAPLSESMKEKYKEAILEQAQAMRLEGEGNNG